MLRNDLVMRDSVVGWSAIKNNLPDLRREIGYLRGLADEMGPDPVLGKLLGGDPAPSRLAL